MHVGVDLRFLDESIYSLYVEQLLDATIFCTPNISYTLYIGKYTPKISARNITFKTTPISNGSLKEQFRLGSLFKKANHTLMIFFNEYKPISYTKPYITLISSLKDVYYQDFKTSLQRHIHLYILEKNLVKSDKIFCLDTNTKNELIERFNIAEKNITCIYGFFPHINIQDTKIKIDIRSKYDIKNDFFIYTASDGIEKNCEKLIKTWQKLIKNDKKVDLVFLSDQVCKNISLRNLVVKYELQQYIHFIGNREQAEYISFHKQSLGAIFPSLYEPFDFEMDTALATNTAIFASNIKSHTSILGENAIFFSPISVNSLYTSINNFLENPIKNRIKYNYTNIVNTYCRQNSTQQFLEIISHYDKTYT